MARIRTIKPAFFRSLTISALPKSTRLTFIGLWTYVDDEGRGVDDARLIKAELWPLDNDYGTKKVGHDLEVLERFGRIRRYEVAGRRYFEVVNWKEHQAISKPQKSSLPPPPPDPLPGLFAEDSRNTPGTSPDDSRLEGKGKEGKGKELAPEAREDGTLRERDDLWDAVVGVCGIKSTELTEHARGGVGRAVSELRRVGAVPTEVSRRARHYREHFTEAALTPSALAKHWAQCANPPPGRAMPKAAPALQRFVERGA